MWIPWIAQQTGRPYNEHLTQALTRQGLSYLTGEFLCISLFIYLHIIHVTRFAEPVALVCESYYFTRQGCCSHVYISFFFSIFSAIYFRHGNTTNSLSL